METNVVSEALHMVHNLLSEVAICTVCFRRDQTDSYSIELTPEDESLRAGFGKKDAMLVLPKGSRWSPALGWRCFFGIPLQTESGTWLVLGAEGVMADEARGAYPVFHGYVFRFETIPKVQLLSLADSIDRGQGSPTIAGGYGIIESGSLTPVDHRSLEARIIRSSVPSYEQGQHLLFRTLVLSEDQLPPNFLLRRFLWALYTQMGIYYSHFLMATVPSISKNFSAGAKIRLALERRCMGG
jgi:hypothetical protein